MEIKSNPHDSLWISLHSGDDEYKCRLSIAAFKKYFTQQLPKWVLAPFEKESEFNGEKFTYLCDRKYGISLTGNYLSFTFGVQDDIGESKQKGFFLPWAEWRHVRHTLLNLDGSIHTPNMKLVGDWKQEEKAIESVPKAKFFCKDFDGEEFTATTYISEREWRLGVGAFKWLRLIAKPKIKRSLVLEFSTDIGDRKGSWKGGTTGTSTEIALGKSPDIAFTRYCKANNIELMHRVG